MKADCEPPTHHSRSAPSDRIIDPVTFLRCAESASQSSPYVVGSFEDYRMLRADRSDQNIAGAHTEHFQQFHRQRRSPTAVEAYREFTIEIGIWDHFCHSFHSR